MFSTDVEIVGLCWQSGIAVAVLRCWSIHRARLSPLLGSIIFRFL